MFIENKLFFQSYINDLDFQDYFLHFVFTL